MAVDTATETCLDSLQTGVVCATATGPAGAWLARRLGLPANGCDRAELRIEALRASDPYTPTRWTRTFGRRSWATIVSVTDGGDLVERFGPLSIHFAVEISATTLVLRSTAMALGPVRWTGPAPVVSATVTSAGDATVSTVEVEMRRLGRLHYVATMHEGSTDA